MTTNVSECFVKSCSNPAEHTVQIKNFTIRVCDECLLKVWDIAAKYATKDQALCLQYMKRIQDMEV